MQISNGHLLIAIIASVICERNWFIVFGQYNDKVILRCMRNTQKASGFGNHKKRSLLHLSYVASRYSSRNISMRRHHTCFRRFPKITFHAIHDFIVHSWTISAEEFYLPPRRGVIFGTGGNGSSDEFSADDDFSAVRLNRGCSERIFVFRHTG
ncbi:MAG: hypothetical protein ACLTL8_09505 [Bifidobacterium pseudocatenulatum]